MPEENWDSIVVDTPSNGSVVSASDEAATEREVELKASPAASEPPGSQVESREAAKPR